MKSILISISILFSLTNTANAKSFLDYCNGTIGTSVTADEADTVAMLKLAMLPKLPWPVKISTIATYDENGEVIRPQESLKFMGYAVPIKTKFARKFNSIKEVSNYLRVSVFGKKSNCGRMNEKFKAMEALQLTVGKFNLKDKSLVSYPLKTITPLSDAKNLKFLILNQNDLTDVSVLANLKNLEFIKMGKNKISSLNFVKDLPNLISLDASQNSIFDLSPLRNAVNLQELTLTSQTVTMNTWIPRDMRPELKDITPLSGLRNLYYLLLGNNGVSDLSPLKDLTALNVLSVKNNKVTDITPLEDLTSLRSLYLSKNNIEDVETLSNFYNIEALSISNNKIKDCSILKGLKHIKKLNYFKNPCSNNTLGPF